MFNVGLLLSDEIPSFEDFTPHHSVGSVLYPLLPQVILRTFECYPVAYDTVIGQYKRTLYVNHGECSVRKLQI
jgi:hypothetical protein